MLIGNSALRIQALGWDDEPATTQASARQQALLREGMQEGAFGHQLGLDYPPGAYADTDELAALAREAGRNGGFYHTHVRYSLGDRFLDPFREAIEIGRRGEAPAHITHFYHRKTFPGTPDQMLELVDDARAEGLDVTFDAYPSEWASTRLLILIPTVGPGRRSGEDEGAPRGPRHARPDPARARTNAAQLFAGAGGLRDIRIGYLRRPENLRWEGQTLGELMDETGTRSGRRHVRPAPRRGPSRRTRSPPARTPTASGDSSDIRSGMVGTDSTFVGDKPSPRTYGSFPRILGQFVRDEGLIGLEEAIRRMTGAAAARLGLRDRGVLRDDAVADLVVFDPSTVRSNATYDEPRRFPDGIEHVIVNGELVVDGGEHTGRTPGRALRHGRD